MRWFYRDWSPANPHADALAERRKERENMRPKHIEEIDYDQLDPGIRQCVRMLRQAGYETCDSGDGETKGDNGLPFGHVVIQVPNPYTSVAELLHVQQHLKRKGLTCVPRPPEGEPAADEVVVELSYNPAEPVAVIVIEHITDAKLELEL